MGFLVRCAQERDRLRDQVHKEEKEAGGRPYKRERQDKEAQGGAESPEMQGMEIVKPRSRDAWERGI